MKFADIPLEQLLEYSVKYGLGVLFAVVILILFVCVLYNDKKTALEREKDLRKEASELRGILSITIASLTTSIDKYKEEFRIIAQYQRNEHKEINDRIIMIQGIVGLPVNLKKEENTNEKSA